MRNNGGSSARAAWLIVVGLLAFMVAFAAGWEATIGLDHQRGRH